MNNLQMLEYCKKHPETSLDSAYMQIEKHKDLRKYVVKVKKIKELLVTIKQIKSRPAAKGILDNVFEELQKELKKYGNYSEFGGFINACDAVISNAIKNQELLKRITYLYLKKRVVNDIVPAEWVQALIDKGSSRNKGQAGENKLIRLLIKRRYFNTKEFAEFKANNRSVAKFSSKGDFALPSIGKNFQEHFGKKSQGKKLDLIIKKGRDVYFLEAKHINTSGGAQNKQIKELIDIIEKKPKKASHHYISYLDGVYFNGLLIDKITGPKKRRNKINKQKNDIVRSLEKNPKNYFINTAGFQKLFA